MRNVGDMTTPYARLRARSLCALLCLCAGLVGCEGPIGPIGLRGDAGERGRAGEAGPRGDAGPVGAQGVRGPTGKAPVAEDPLPIAAMGIVGRVHDPAGQLVGSGTVYLVPASDVATLAKHALDTSLSPSKTVADRTDEPLEDLVDQHGAKYAHAAVSTDGSYRISQVSTGSYFLAWFPDAHDAFHLPGGDHCRTALGRPSLIGQEIDLVVSGRASAQATYVGSSTCLGCHGRQRSERSAHRVGLSVPGLRGPLQDTSHWPTFDAAITAFDRGTTLYYYDCDATKTSDAKCSVSDHDPTITSPGSIVSFELALVRNTAVAKQDVGAYVVTFKNDLGAGSVTYPVALTYGGALERQQLLTRLANGNATFSYFVLPVQFNATGVSTYPSTDDWPWKDVHSEQWYDFAHSALTTPDNARAFDNNCAGCHFTGMRLTGDLTAGFGAHAVGEGNGDFDYDGDGRKEEINVGCESCHGPASEHLEAKVRGVRIVSPSLLTPERETLICGRCHSRPQGLGGGGTEAPLAADGTMPPPGLRRSEFAASFTARVDAADTDHYPSGDSKANHQQYTDFVQSGMYRNPLVLMTCTSCHDAHGNDQNTDDLKNPEDDNSACTGCHSGSEFTAPRGHIGKVAKDPHTNVDDSVLLCTTCHMVRTALGGARHPELLDSIPPSAMPVQYFHGDLASHRFSVAPRAQYAVQPVAATSQCAFCHGTDFPNP